MPDAANAQGLAVTTAAPEITHSLDESITAYLGARADARERLRTLLAADPDCVLALCLDGYLFLHSSKRDGLLSAKEVAAHARAAMQRRGVTQREESHVVALEAWCRGQMRTAAHHWEALLAEFPRDILALRISQFVMSYIGETERMRAIAAAALPAWDDDTPGYGWLLGIYAYALEETGDYALAEETGRRAVELNREDIWAAHAVAHVREMEGRLREGIDWIGHCSPYWEGCNNFGYHLKWHQALYHLELEQYRRVLELYDRDVRPTSTDEYLDITNAVSLLWRLEQAEVDVTHRWWELAERSRAHVEDHGLVFADVHYVMALAAVDDSAAIEEFLASSSRFARTSSSTEAVVMDEVGLRLARAIVAHRRGEYERAVDLLLPIRHKIRLIGGSNAQRDLFEQLLIDAVLHSRRFDLAEELLSRRVVQRPRNLWGWKHYAAVLDATGSTRAAGARRQLERLRQ